MTEGKRRPKAIAEIARAACIGCEQCLPVCPVDAITIDAEGIALVDAEACTGCRKCVEACPADAIAMSGGAEEQPAAEHEVRKETAPVRQELASCQPPAPEIWVFLEHTDGRPAPVSWELLGKARSLAADLEGRVCGVLLGHQVQALSQEAFAYGADAVYLIDDPALAHYRTQPYLHGLARLVRTYHPEIMLLGASTMGRDLAGAVATTLGTGLTADCTGLAIDAQTKLLEQTRPAYGGNIMATILCETQRPQMATVRPRVMPLPPRDDSRTGEVIREELALAEKDVLVRILEYAREEDVAAVRIEDANILISGGRGLGGPAGFEMLAGLAKAIGGAVSGSRAAVDHGWIDHARQVGQTGKTVRPKLYLACGISGAIQHLVGMETADVIVAINRDPNAPIFGVATYGLVGDVNEIVPALTRAIRTRLPNRGGADG
ncbi:MAG TPA: FAD-binding protein [Armatimonadota bacterium]|nr:FAD-binding protein [Armatimonadota bacterium]